VAVKPTHGGDWYSAYKPAVAARGPLPLLPPPPSPEKPVSATTTATDQKPAAIKTNRGALGLYYKCTAKWSKDHRCSPEVLQAVDALWDSFSSGDSLADSSPDDDPTAHLMLVLSKSVMSGILAAHIVRLMGSIQQIPM